MKRLLSVSLLACLAALPAQDKASPWRFVPADSLVVLRLGAPAKWKAQFGGTNVARLFAGKSLGPLVKQANTGIEQMLEQVRKSGAFDADLLQGLLDTYRGDIVLSVQADLSKLEAAIESDEPPPFSMVLAMTPDGTYKLDALAAEIEKSAEKDGAPLRDLKVADHTLRVLQLPRGTMVLPTLLDGHLVTVIGTDLEKSAARLLGTADRFAGEAGNHAMSFHVKTGTAIDAVMKIVAAQAENQGAPFDVAAMLKQLGIGAIGDLDMSIGADGEHMVSELSLAIGETDRGLFAAFESAAKSPALLRYVPADCDAFSVMPFRIGALVDVVAKVWDGLGDQVPMTWTDAQAAFADTMKVRLKEDLLDHLGDEMLSMQDMAAGMDDDSPLAMFEGMCLGMSLRNGKAFGESLEKLLRSQGLHAARKSEDYQDTKIHRLTIGGMLPLEYAVTDDLLLLSLGKAESGAKALRGVLDMRKNPAAAGELPAVLKAGMAKMPAGWNSVTAMSMPATVQGVLSAIETAMGQMPIDMPPEVEGILQMLRGVASEMKELGLETQASAGWWSPRGYLARSRW